MECYNQVNRRFFASAFGAVLLASLAVIAAYAQPHVDYDHRVVFDNGATDDSYYHSETMVVAPSELANQKERVPLSTAHFGSPPNSLRLQWKSAPGGDWRATLKVASRYGRRFEFVGDTLSLWCFSEEGLAVDDAPRIFVQDASGAGLPTIPLLAHHGPLPAQVGRGASAIRSVCRSISGHRG